MKALAITDHGNMFGAVAFHDACREQGLKPILGCEVYVATGSRFDEQAPAPREAYNHLTLLARERRRLPQPGEARLHRLHRGLLPPPAHRQGGPGEAQRGARRPLGLPLQRDRGGTCAGNEAEALASVGRVRRDLREGPLLPRDDGPRHRGAAAGEPGLLRLRQQTGLPLVATNDAHYLPQRRPPGPRRAALHRHRQEGAATRSASASTRRSST